LIKNNPLFLFFLFFSEEKNKNRKKKFKGIEEDNTDVDTPAKETPSPGLFGVIEDAFDEISIPLFEKVFID